MGSPIDAPGHMWSASPRACARCRELTRERRPARLALVERIRAMPRVEDAPHASGVYVLLDPRDATARYVGSSRRPVERIGEHRRERRTGTDKHTWLAALDACGMRPDAYLVHRATRERGGCGHCGAAWGAGYGPYTPGPRSRPPADIWRGMPPAEALADMLAARRSGPRSGPVLASKPRQKTARRSARRETIREALH